MLTTKDIMQINEMLEAGWSLVGPNSLTTGWYLQKGKPGAGGETVRVHAAIASRKADQLVRISQWRSEYCRPEFRKEYAA
jgi:hypothetical protein